MNVISISDLGEHLFPLFRLAEEMKREREKGIARDSLGQKTLAMIFEKASTRTRVSFEVAMTQLGGHAVHLDWKGMQLERGESLRDTARTLGRYVDGIMMRAHSHEDVVEMGRHAEVPVINGLTDREHPCQALSDLFTIYEVRGSFEGLKLAYVGDGNNVCHSLLLGSSLVGMEISIASPQGYGPKEKIREEAERYARQTGGKIEILEDPERAVEGADILYTDVWVSMGQEGEAEERRRVFQNYQINRALVEKAGNPLIMHCLPAKRGFEITEDVLEGDRSIVMDQAENRLHAQKALLEFLLG
jgi:ornithine carbamoyltransferase